MDVKGVMIMKRILGFVILALVVIISAAFLGTAGSKGGSPLYGQYLVNPRTPTVGNMYIDPLRSATAAAEPNAQAQAPAAGTGETGGTVYTGTGGFAGLGDLPAGELDTCAAE
jgi:uncharacterized membrane protein